MPIYAIGVTKVVLVYGEDSEDAIINAEKDWKEIKTERDFEFDLDRPEALTKDQLKEYGWDEECLPYGHDGNTRIKDLL